MEVQTELVFFFQVDYFGEKQVFTPEQLVAIFLVKLKDITEHSSHGIRNVSDCVVSVCMQTGFLI